VREVSGFGGGEDQSPERIRGMFASITPTYDFLNRFFSGWWDERWRARAAWEALGGLEPCRRVLDLATGTGDLARALRRAAAKAGAGGVQFHGADFTRPMLRRAMAKLGGAPYHWIEADGLRLPYRAGAFDALTIGFGLRNMVDKEAALVEMARVVRPGGRVAILEFGQPHGRAVRRLYDLYAHKIMPRVGRWISGSDAYGYLTDSIREFWSSEMLAAAMRKAGFEQVRAKPMMFGIVNLHVGVRGAKDAWDL
jgi:demethylmenaquinone methyltransferase/2-methoxy-6-polyprenyl-1,4-benzoquinol methylase